MADRGGLTPRELPILIDWELQLGWRDQSARTAAAHLSRSAASAAVAMSSSMIMFLSCLVLFLPGDGQTSVAASIS
jgi:hypothetical protein